MWLGLFHFFLSLPPGWIFPLLTCCWSDNVGGKTITMTLFTKECKFWWVNSISVRDTNMSSLYMWGKTDLMPGENVYPPLNITDTGSDFDLINLCAHKFHNFRQLHFIFLSKYIWHSADLWLTNYSLRNLPSKQRPMPRTTFLSSFHDATAPLGVISSLTLSGGDAQDDGLYSWWQERGWR